MKPLRVELRAKNNVLWHAIFDHYPSVAAFCAAHGHPHRQGAVGGYLALQSAPYRRDGQLTPVARWLCESLVLSPGELWPPALYQAAIPTMVAGEYDPEALVSLVEAQRQGALAPGPEGPAEASERRRVLTLALAQLSPRQAFVLTRRFLDADEPTLEQVGQELRVSRSRVREIEVKALRELRRPLDRNRELREVR
jgi:RNA polymerase sigma factor (sigma-70 family)